MMGALGGNGDLMELMKIMQSDDGIAGLMEEPLFEAEEGGKYSQADMLADVVNILRMDAKMFGQIYGVPVEIGRCSPEKMAWMLQEMVKGNPAHIIETFNEIEQLHHEVMEEVMEEEEFDSYIDMKDKSMFTKRSMRETAAEGGETIEEAAAEVESEADADADADEEVEA